jgi:diguanylate cyclase (GGDEF)-like protein
LIPEYESLNATLTTASVARLTLARTLDSRTDLMQLRLQQTMVGAGLGGLLIMLMLFYTARAYRRRAERANRRELGRLEDAALRDSLTGLGNHRAFYEDFAKEIARSRRHGQPLTLALIDVDDLKSLNDTGGHKKGDEALIGVSQALSSGRREDRAYRVGGDEFAMLLVQARGNEAKVAVTRLQHVMRGMSGRVTVSIGLCELENDQHEHDVYERADAALYAAKRAGRDTVVDFATICGITTIFSSTKTAALRTLLEDRAIEVAFQPIWKLCERTILGFEALSRPHPSLGLTGPQEAFDIAEQQRKVVELDNVCMHKVLDASKTLSPDVLLFINIAPETLGRGDFSAGQWVRAIRAAGLKPEQIVMEVTERRITDTSELVRHATELRELGVRIALDDTGIGYAGLEVLSKLSFDFVKIDRSVMSDALKQPRARGILAGIIAIARAAGSYVIAEGIERVEQLEFLRDLPEVPKASFAGIRGAQGYLLGRPCCGAPHVTEFMPYSGLIAASIELAS